jgi:hypothetical protein
MPRRGIILVENHSKSEAQMPAALAAGKWEAKKIIGL